MFWVHVRDALYLDKGIRSVSDMISWAFTLQAYFVTQIYRKQSIELLYYACNGIYKDRLSWES